MSKAFVATYFDPTKFVLTRHGLQPKPVNVSPTDKPVIEVLVVAPDESEAIARVKAEAEIPEGFDFGGIVPATADQVLV